ncbi:MAG TPA: hypothetical protein VLS87_02185 [Woeseiaceae bacterium]|nr:hypothetical protein [Woeseiaceae bacterium]
MAEAGKQTIGDLLSASDDGSYAYRQSELAMLETCLADSDTAVADVLLALDQNGIGEAEKAEVAAILESLRPAVMGTGG